MQHSEEWFPNNSTPMPRLPPVGTVINVDFGEIHELLSMQTDEFDCDYSHPSGCQTHDWLAPSPEALAKGCPNARRRRVLENIKRGFVL